MTAISRQSSIFTCALFFLPPLSFAFEKPHCCLTVVRFFACTVLCSFPNFPPRLINAPLPSLIRWCCRDFPRTTAANRRTHTHTHKLEDSFKKPGRFSTSSATGSWTGRGGEQRRNHCWLNAHEWFMAPRGREGDRDVVMHLCDTPLSDRPDCNLLGPLVTHYCFSFLVS